MINTYKKIITAALTVTCSVSVAATTYPLGMDDVYKQSLGLSNEYQALEQEQQSSKRLLEVEQKFYMPKLTLTSDLNHYYGSPSPDPENTDNLILKAEVKLYGTGLEDRVSAANLNAQASAMALENESLELYYTVMRYLAKIERTRQYQSNIVVLDGRIADYTARQQNASEQGSSSLSSFKDAQLTQKRFQDSVARVSSNIDQNFRALRDATGFVVTDTNLVGIESTALEKLYALDINVFNETVVFDSNFELRNRAYLLEGQLKTAQAQRERFAVNLINESHFDMFGNGDLNAGDIKNTSYIGLKLTYDLYNYQNDRNQKSAFDLYYAESIRFEKQREQFLARVESAKRDYADIKEKRASLLEQIELNEELVKTQENELLINKLEYVDVVKSLSSLNDSYTTLLNYDISLIDSIIDMLLLFSVKLELHEE